MWSFAAHISMPCTFQLILPTISLAAICISTIQMRKLKCWHKISSHATRKKHNHNLKPSLSDCKLSDLPQCNISSGRMKFGMGSDQECWRTVAAKTQKECWWIQVYPKSSVGEIIRSTVLLLYLLFQLVPWFWGPRTMNNWGSLCSVFYWLEVDNMDFMR